MTTIMTETVDHYRVQAMTTTMTETVDYRVPRLARGVAEALRHQASARNITAAELIERLWKLRQEIAGEALIGDPGRLPRGWLTELLEAVGLEPDVRQHVG